MTGIEGRFEFEKNDVQLSSRPFAAWRIDSGSGSMGELAAAFDGKLYNAESLRKKLGLGKADTVENVVLALYEKYGVDAFEMMDGMFSAAIFDRSSGRLVIARDRAGEKPLYYTCGDGFFAFSSSLKRLVDGAGVKKTIDSEALCQYFRLGYIFAPLTIYENVHSLEPGCCITVSSDGKAEKYEYFKISFEPAGTYDECKRQLRDVLIGSVEQCISDEGPTGVFLSGGIDSTIVTGIASTILGKKISSFTVGFAEREYDETGRALIAAKAHGTDHHVITLSSGMALGKLDTIIGGMEQPFADSSAIPTYIVNEFAKTYLNTVLTGDGSDQILAGSSRYLVNYYASLYNRIPEPLRKNVIEKLIYALPDKSSLTRKLRKVVGSSELDVYSRRERMMSLVLNEDELRLALGGVTPSQGMENVRALYDRYRDTADELSRTLFTDLKVVVEGGMIAKMGSMSRLAGIEARMPVVSKKMLELSFRIPSEYKLRGRVGKYILRDAFAGMIPDGLKKASKKGFGVPLDVWFRGPLKQTLMEALGRDLIESQGIFNYGYIERLLEEHFSGRANRDGALWALYVFQRWYMSEFDI